MSVSTQRLFSARTAALTLIALASAVAPVVAPVAAQQGYQQPPAAVARILDAPARPQVLTSPDKSLLVMLERPGLPSIATISEPEYRLAGIRLNPRTSCIWIGCLPAAGSATRRGRRTAS